MKQLASLLIILIVITLLLTRAAPAQAEGWTCPTADNTYIAIIYSYDADEEWEINPDKVFAIHEDSAADLGFASRPDRWQLNGKNIQALWEWKYRVTFYAPPILGEYEPVGEAWIETHPDHPTLYFIFFMPNRVTYDAEGQMVVERIDHLFCPQHNYYAMTRVGVLKLLAKG